MVSSLAVLTKFPGFIRASWGYCSIRLFLISFFFSASKTFSSHDTLKRCTGSLGLIKLKIRFVLFCKKRSCSRCGCPASSSLIFLVSWVSGWVWVFCSSFHGFRVRILDKGTIISRSNLVPEISRVSSSGLQTYTFQLLSS